MKKSAQKKSCRVSVVLATYNEAANIDRCLQAVAQWADEIIVVDGSSADDTVKRAEAFGARVIVTTNKPIFHINKQMAMDAATGELILQLDADEVVDTELSKFIQRLKQTIDLANYDVQTEPVAWWIRRKNFFLGTFLKKGGQYPDPVIRLYIAGYAMLPQKNVHEQMSVTGITATAEGHFIHYSNPTFADYLRKWNAYSSLAAQDLFTEKKELSFFVGFQYLCYKPLATFLLLFIRHKGFVDGFPGFVFALMSGLLHVTVLLKTWELSQQSKQ